MLLSTNVLRIQQSRSRESKKALNLGFIFRPQTRCAQYFYEGLDRSFVGAFGAKFAFVIYRLPTNNSARARLGRHFPTFTVFLLTLTSTWRYCLLEWEKGLSTNENDIKWITRGVTKSRMLDGKADGCSQWFLSRQSRSQSPLVFWSAPRPVDIRFLVLSKRPVGSVNEIVLSFGAGGTNCSWGK